MTGRLWTVDTFIQDGGASSGSSGERPTLRFGEDGSVEVSEACRTGSGTFERKGDSITLRAMQYVEDPCADNSPAMVLGVQQVLSDGTVQVEIDAARLTLTRGDLGLSATTP